MNYEYRDLENTLNSLKEDEFDLGKLIIIKENVEYEIEWMEEIPENIKRFPAYYNILKDILKTINQL